MKFLFLFLSFNTFSQVKDLRIFESDSNKVDLTLINDTLAFLTYNDFESEQYILGVLDYKNDTLFFREIDDDLEIKSDIYYSENNEIGSNYVMIQSHYSHLFLKLETTYHGLNYKINDSLYYPEKNDYRHSIIIKKPVSNEFRVDIYDGVILKGGFYTKLLNSNNVVSYKMTELRTYFDYMHDLSSWKLKKVNINGNLLNVKLIFL